MFFGIVFTFFLKFADNIAEELLTTGRTRELYVFGCLDALRYLLLETNDDAVWAIGIIDLVELHPPSSDDSGRDEIRVPFLMDNKTRSTPSLPGFAQKRTSRMQMMLYKFLFDALAQSASFPCDWLEEFLRARGLNPAARATSSDVLQELGKYGLANETLLEISRAAMNSFQALSVSSASLRVVYEMQGSKAVLGEDRWKFDHNHLQGDVGYFMEFWTGRRGPNAVLSGESWKCRQCQYLPMCSVSPCQPEPIAPSSTDANSDHGTV